MGLSYSSLYERGVQKLAFHSPNCNYTLGQCEMAYTLSGESVALKLFSPSSICKDDTKQRWMARQDYIDERSLVIFSHGNSDDIGTCSAYCQWLADSLNVNLVSYDYKGYGRSLPGTTTEKNTQEYLEAVYDLAVNRMGVPASKLILIGKSIGTGPTILFAGHKKPVKCIVLISPLASGARCMIRANQIPSSVMEKLDDLFMPTLHSIKLIDVPIFIIHGTEDDIVPINNGKLLHSLCRPCSQYPPLYVKANHNDIEHLFSSEFCSKIKKFLTYADEIPSGDYHRDVND